MHRARRRRSDHGRISSQPAPRGLARPVVAHRQASRGCDVYALPGPGALRHTAAGYGWRGGFSHGECTAAGPSFHIYDGVRPDRSGGCARARRRARLSDQAVRPRDPVSKSPRNLVPTRTRRRTRRPWRPPSMRRIEALLRRLAPRSLPILLTGETGSGKEVCARFLHQIAPAAAEPFMAVNCAAIPGASGK